MNRKQITLEINKHLDVCELCEKKPPSDRTSNKDFLKVCGECETYSKLRELGDKLNSGNFNKERKARKLTKRRSLKMTVEEYLEYKKQGLSDTQIAVKKDTAPQNIYNWKNKRKDELNKAESADDKQPVENQSKKCECHDWKKKYNSLFEDHGKLHEKYNARETVIKELEEELAAKNVAIKNLNEQLNKLTSDKENMEEVFDSAMADKENLHKENITLRNEIDNIKNQINLIRSMRDDNFEEYKALERKAHAMQMLLVEYLSKDVS